MSSLAALLDSANRQAPGYVNLGVSVDAETQILTIHANLGPAFSRALYMNVTT